MADIAKRRGATAKKTLESYTLLESIPEALEEVVPGMCALGADTLFFGGAGQGKTTFTETIITSIISGTTRPGEAPGTTHPPGQVIYLIAEDNRANSVSPRLRGMLRAAGLTDAAATEAMRYVHIVEGAKLGEVPASIKFMNDVQVIKDKVDAVELLHPDVPVLLIVVSPVTAYEGAEKGSDPGDAVRTAWMAMIRLLKDYNIAGWYVTHPRKGDSEGNIGSAMDQQIGSSQRANAARYLMMICRCPDVNEDGSKSLAKVILRVKANSAGTVNAGGAYGLKLMLKPFKYIGTVAKRTRIRGVTTTAYIDGELPSTRAEVVCRYDRDADEVLKELNGAKQDDKKEVPWMLASQIFYEIRRLGGHATAAHISRMFSDAGAGEYVRRKVAKILKQYKMAECTSGRMWEQLNVDPAEPPAPTTDQTE